MTMGTMVVCSSCGALTDWDDKLQVPILCVNCWDARSDRDNKLAAGKRAWREANKEKVAAGQRAKKQLGGGAKCQSD